MADRHERVRAARSPSRGVTPWSAIGLVIAVVGALVSEWLVLIGLVLLAAAVGVGLGRAMRPALGNQRVTTSYGFYGSLFGHTTTRHDERRSGQHPSDS